MLAGGWSPRGRVLRAGGPRGDVAHLPVVDKGTVGVCLPVAGGRLVQRPPLAQRPPAEGTAAGVGRARVEEAGGGQGAGGQVHRPREAPECAPPLPLTPHPLKHGRVSGARHIRQSTRFHSLFLAFFHGCWSNCCFWLLQLTRGVVC